ncbi:MAG: fused MFS/spermidine synthase [Desulfatirhabdiaceae bacterium]
MLEIAVFLCGAVVMVIELTGSRVLAPYLGTSLVVWTSLIGVILASLSIGYWWGGRLADRRPEARLLAGIILISAFATAFVVMIKPFVLGFLQAQSGGLHLTVMSATLLLFAPPSILIGMVSPFAVRLKLEDTRTSGRTAGNLYAISTVGSISGTFLAGFVLIPVLGSTNILLLMAAVLVVASMLVERSHMWIKAATCTVFLILLFLTLGYDKKMAAAGFVDVDTPYNRVLVFNGKEKSTGRIIRIMITGPHAWQSAMYMDDPVELVLPYSRFYRLAKYFAPDMHRLLVLGGGGFSFPKYAMENYVNVRVDVVELDPGITALARDHFGLRDHPRLNIIEEDARTFLNRNVEKYEVILCDTFNSHYAVPFHLTTVETMQRIKASMTPGGVVLINLLSAIEGDRGRFFRALFATCASTFPRVMAFAVNNPNDPFLWQNIIIAAFVSEAEPRVPSPDLDIAAMLANRLKPPVDSDIPLLTDEFAPVDRYVFSAW